MDKAVHDRRWFPSDQRPRASVAVELREIDEHCQATGATTADTISEPANIEHAKTEATFRSEAQRGSCLLGQGMGAGGGRCVPGAQGSLAVSAARKIAHGHLAPSRISAPF